MAWGVVIFKNTNPYLESVPVVVRGYMIGA